LVDLLVGERVDDSAGSAGSSRAVPAAEGERLDDQGWH
jgi:hypothetical protein